MNYLKSKKYEFTTKIIWEQEKTTQGFLKRKDY
jgi:hypothetical protein